MKNNNSIHDTFEKDDYPGKPKILFIGLNQASHTHSWISHLSNMDINVRLFSSSYGIPPQGWQVRTYVISPIPQQDFNPQYQKSLFINPLELHRTIHYLTNKYLAQIVPFSYALTIMESFNTFFKKKQIPPGTTRNAAFSNNREHEIQPLDIYAAPQKSNKSEIFPFIHKQVMLAVQAWMAQIIREWQPDIIHTLGLFDSQGGELYFDTRQKYHLERYGKWILQLKGGSDLTLRRYNPALASRIKKITGEAQQIISDNVVNFHYLKMMGVSPDKFSSISPVPGTGGIDLESIRSGLKTNASQRDRLIIYPKAYETRWSKSLPVLEAIRLAWERIKPCKIIFTAVGEETIHWFITLPEEIQQSSTLMDRIPREELLAMMGKARVLLIPTLIDGIPNSMYEAMAYGLLPIVSPLETIKTVVENEKNVLFARNLYPEEIAQALTRAMNDDHLVETAAKNNLEVVRRYADRDIIRNKIQNFYLKMVSNKNNC